MTAKKAATSAKHKTATKKHAASAKHTETKAQLAHLHVLHVEHEAHLAHLKATGKSVTVKAKPAKPAKAAKKVAFAVGDLLPVCSFEAVAQSLRLIGQRVDDDDVAELWSLLGEPADGVPVGEALGAWNRFGVVGGSLTFLQVLPELGVIPAWGELAADVVAAVVTARAFHAAILRVDVPGPHAVLATADGWWSWGELHSPWPARVSEAWAVSWS